MYGVTSLFFVRSMHNTQMNCVGRTWKFWTLNLVVPKVTSGLWRVKHVIRTKISSCLLSVTTWQIYMKCCYEGPTLESGSVNFNGLFRPSMGYTCDSRSKAENWGQLFVGIAGSNPAGDMDVCLFWSSALWDRGLCIRLIIRQEDSYRVCRVWVWSRKLTETC